MYVLMDQQVDRGVQRPSVDWSAFFSGSVEVGIPACESSDSLYELKFSIDFAFVDGSIIIRGGVGQRFVCHEVDSNVVTDDWPSDGFGVLEEPLHTEPSGAFVGCSNGIPDLPLDERWCGRRPFRWFVAVVETREDEVGFFNVAKCCRQAAGEVITGDAEGFKVT